MSKNKFTPLTELPDKQIMESMIEDLQYKRINISDLPEPIIHNGLVSKFNSVLLTASGSSEGMLYSMVGIRIDHDKIDEHPFVIYYDYQDPSKNFGGIIDHGNWTDRTIEMTSFQIEAMAASGLTASFNYKSLPANSSGSLYDLSENNMLNGIVTQFNLLNDKKPK